MSTTEAETAVPSRADLVAEVARLQFELDELSSRLQPRPRRRGLRKPGLGRGAMTLIVARRAAARWLPEGTWAREQLLGRKMVPVLVIWRVLGRRVAHRGVRR